MVTTATVVDLVERDEQCNISVERGLDGAALEVACASLLLHTSRSGLRRAGGSLFVGFVVCVYVTVQVFHRGNI